MPLLLRSIRHTGDISAGPEPWNCCGMAPHSKWKPDALDVKPATGKMAWWICLSGHEYKSKIANRTALGRGCPYCSGQKIGYGNDLASRAPHIAAEWHPSLNGTLRPGDVTTGVQRRFWWLCQQGSFAGTAASACRRAEYPTVPGGLCQSPVSDESSRVQLASPCFPKPIHGS